MRFRDTPVCNRPNRESSKRSASAGFETAIGNPDGRPHNDDASMQSVAPGIGAVKAGTGADEAGGRAADGGNRAQGIFEAAPGMRAIAVGTYGDAHGSEAFNFVRQALKRALL